MYRYDTDTDVVRVDERTWTSQVRPGWAIAGNPNGGYLLSLVGAAARQAVPHGDLLTTNAHYLSPSTVGPCEITVDVVKAGRRTSTVTASLVQDGRERVRTLATFADLDAAAGPTALRLVPPTIPGPDECVPREEAPAATASFPEFVERFDIRLSPEVGWVRGEPRGTAVIEGWIRFADGRDADVGALPLFADAFPPAVFEVVQAAWVPTLEFTVHVRGRPDPGWLLARFSTRALVDGFLEEDGELWDESGRLVAMSRQLAMVIPG